MTGAVQSKAPALPPLAKFSLSHIRFSIDQASAEKSHVPEQPKWHYKVLKVPVTGPKSRLLHIFLSDTYTIVGNFEIQLGEDFGTVEAVQSLIKLLFELLF